MRKITQNVVNAFMNKDNANFSNTSILNGSVYLHGNEIVRTIDEYTIEISFCGWTTPTTAERINAIVYAFTNGGVNIGIKGGKPEYRPRADGCKNKSFDSNEWLKINKYYGI